MISETYQIHPWMMHRLTVSEWNQIAERERAREKAEKAAERKARSR